MRCAAPHFGHISGGDIGHSIGPVGYIPFRLFRQRKRKLAQNVRARMGTCRQVLLANIYRQVAQAACASAWFVLQVRAMRVQTSQLANQLAGTLGTLREPCRTAWWSALDMRHGEPRCMHLSDPYPTCWPSGDVPAISPSRCDATYQSQADDI